MGLAWGWPCTEMPYSISVPITRRTVTVRAYAQQPPGPRGQGGCAHAVVGRWQQDDEQAVARNVATEGAVLGRTQRVRRFVPECAFRGLGIVKCVPFLSFREMARKVNWTGFAVVTVPVPPRL